MCDALPPHSRPRPILPVAKRVRFGDDIPPLRTSGQSRSGPREFGEDASERTTLCAIHPYSLSLHHHRYVDCAVGAACTASGGVAHAAQPVSLAHTHNSTRLRDSVRQATSQVQRRSRDVGGSPDRPCLARGDCCPPGKGCNQAGPSSRDEAGVLQPLLHRTQERWWPLANPGSASLEPGFAQAPVQDADAQSHDQMHSAPGLVCSDRPEGHLLSRFDPSATQTVSTVCVWRSGMAVQGPPIRALPVSPCVHEGCRGRPYPVTGSGRQDPQLPRRLAYSSPIQRAVGRSQGLGAPAPQPVGASGQLGKEQALPCAENLFSRCGVRLGEYDGTPHGGTCPSSAELPEFLQRQECGTTETVSEASGAYGIRSCSHAARIASYETTSALATIPGPEVGMAPRYTASRYLPAVSPFPQPLDRPCLFTGRGAPWTSVPAYCCHNRCLQHGLGRYMQRAGSLGALDRAPTALAHQLPGAVGSAFSLAAVPATAVGQARASPHGQHCGGLVYQPAGGYTITPHVVFGPVYSHVVLRPRPGYVPKVPTTPFSDQVVNLQALPSEEADPSLALLCPVRALRVYVTRTRSVRSSEQLFVCHGGQQKGKAVSKQRLAHWIVEAVALACQSQGEPCPLGVRAYSTRSVASSHALAHGASLADICRVWPDSPSGNPICVFFHGKVSLTVNPCLPCDRASVRFCWQPSSLLLGRICLRVQTYVVLPQAWASPYQCLYMLPPFGQDVASVAPFYERLASLPLRQAVTKNRKDLKLSFTEGRNPFRFRGERNSGLAISSSDVPVGTKVSEFALER